MAIKLESFLTIEKSLSQKLLESWQKGIARKLSKVGRLTFEGQYEEAARVLDTLDFAKAIKGNKKQIQFAGASAAIYGGREFGPAKSLQVSQSKGAPKEVKQSSNQLLMLLEHQGTAHIRKKARAVLDKEIERQAEEARTRVQKAEEPQEQKSFVKALATTVNHEGKAVIDLGSSLHTSRMSAWGFTLEAEFRGMEFYQVTEQLDSRGCEVCAVMHGKVFPVQTAKRRLVEHLSIEDPGELKALAPWPKQTKSEIKKLKEMSPEDIIKAGWDTPPYHPLCRGVLRKTSSTVEISGVTVTPVDQPKPVIPDVKIRQQGVRHQLSRLLGGGGLFGRVARTVAVQYVLPTELLPVYYSAKLLSGIGVVDVVESAATNKAVRAARTYFKGERFADTDHEIVMLDIAKANALWRAHSDAEAGLKYIPMLGSKKLSEQYTKYLAGLRKTFGNKPVEMPEVDITPLNMVSILHGDLEFASMRDSGSSIIPVVMTPAGVKRASKLGLLKDPAKDREPSGKWAAERSTEAHTDIRNTDPVMREALNHNHSFVMNSVDERIGLMRVELDMAALDKAWLQAGKQDYIFPGGEGGIKTRYPRFAKWLGDNPVTPIEMPDIGIRDSGSVIFGNGRHRTAVLRDLGYKTIPVAMTEEYYKKAIKFGLVAKQEKAPDIPTLRAPDTTPEGVEIPTPEAVSLSDKLPSELLNRQDSAYVFHKQIKLAGSDDKMTGEDYFRRVFGDEEDSQAWFKGVVKDSSVYVDLDQDQLAKLISPITPEQRELMPWLLKDSVPHLQSRELSLYGVAVDRGDSLDAPTYGFLGGANPTKTLFREPGDGGVLVKLKRNKVEDRTTITMHAKGDREYNVVATPLADPDIITLSPIVKQHPDLLETRLVAKANTIDEVTDVMPAQAQVFGGINFDDIEAIYVQDVALRGRIVAQLKKEGRKIPVRQSEYHDGIDALKLPDKSQLGRVTRASLNGEDIDALSDDWIKYLDVPRQLKRVDPENYPTLTGWIPPESAGLWLDYLNKPSSAAARRKLARWFYEEVPKIPLEDKEVYSALLSARDMAYRDPDKGGWVKDVYPSELLMGPRAKFTESPKLLDKGNWGIIKADYNTLDDTWKPITVSGEPYAIEVIPPRWYPTTSYTMYQDSTLYRFFPSMHVAKAIEPPTIDDLGNLQWGLKNPDTRTNKVAVHTLISGTPINKIGSVSHRSRWFDGLINKQEREELLFTDYILGNLRRDANTYVDTGDYPSLTFGPGPAFNRSTKAFVDAHPTINYGLVKESKWGGLEVDLDYKFSVSTLDKVLDQYQDEAAVTAKVLERIMFQNTGYEVDVDFDEMERIQKHIKDRVTLLTELKSTAKDGKLPRYQVVKSLEDGVVYKAREDFVEGDILSIHPDLPEGYTEALSTFDEVKLRTYLPDYERGHLEVETYKELYAKIFGETDAQLKKRLKTTLDKTSVYMALDEKTLIDGVLGNPELKFMNSLESGKGSFSINGLKRVPKERRMFGVTAPPEDYDKFPKYGFLSEEEGMYNPKMIGFGYGETFVKFKKDIESRTTFTLTDSYDGNSSGTMAPAVLKEQPDPVVLKGLAGNLSLVSEAGLKGFTHINDIKYGPYAEAQVYGKLSMADVDEVMTHSTAIANRVREAAKAKGLDVKVVPLAIDERLHTFPHDGGYYAKGTSSRTLTHSLTPEDIDKLGDDYVQEFFEEEFLLEALRTNNRDFPSDLMIPEHIQALAPQGEMMNIWRAPIKDQRTVMKWIASEVPKKDKGALGDDFGLWSEYDPDSVGWVDDVFNKDLLKAKYRRPVGVNDQYNRDIDLGKVPVYEVNTPQGVDSRFQILTETNYRLTATAIQKDTDNYLLDTALTASPVLRKVADDHTARMYVGNNGRTLDDMGTVVPLDYRLDERITGTKLDLVPENEAKKLLTSMPMDVRQRVVLADYMLGTERELKDYTYNSSLNKVFSTEYKELMKEGVEMRHHPIIEKGLGHHVALSKDNIKQVTKSFDDKVLADIRTRYGDDVYEAVIVRKEKLEVLAGKKKPTVSNFITISDGTFPVRFRGWMHEHAAIDFRGRMPKPEPKELRTWKSNATSDSPLWLQKATKKVKVELGKGDVPSYKNGVISMGDYAPDDEVGKHLFRHEVGHAIDFQTLEGEALSSTKDFTRAVVHDRINFARTAIHNKEIDIDKRFFTSFDRFDIHKGFGIEKATDMNKMIQTVPFLENHLGIKVEDLQALTYGTDPLSADEIAGFINAMMDNHPEDMAKVLLRIDVDPSGRITDKGLLQVQNRARGRWALLSDATSITTNRMFMNTDFGWAGRTGEYLSRDGVSDAEIFANVFGMLGDENPAFRKITKYFFPNYTEVMQKEVQSRAETGVRNAASLLAPDTKPVPPNIAKLTEQDKIPVDLLKVTTLKDRETVGGKESFKIEGETGRWEYTQIDTEDIPKIVVEHLWRDGAHKNIKPHDVRITSVIDDMGKPQQAGYLRRVDTDRVRITDADDMDLAKAKQRLWEMSNGDEDLGLSSVESEAYRRGVEDWLLGTHTKVSDLEVDRNTYRLYGSKDASRDLFDFDNNELQSDSLPEIFQLIGIHKSDSYEFGMKLPGMGPLTSDLNKDLGNSYVLLQGIVERTDELIKMVDEFFPSIVGYRTKDHLLMHLRSRRELLHEAVALAKIYDKRKHGDKHQGGTREQYSVVASLMPLSDDDDALFGSLGYDHFGVRWSPVWGYNEVTGDYHGDMTKYQVIAGGEPAIFTEQVDNLVAPLIAQHIHLSMGGSAIRTNLPKMEAMQVDVHYRGKGGSHESESLTGIATEIIGANRYNEIKALDELSPAQLAQQIPPPETGISSRKPLQTLLMDYMTGSEYKLKDVLATKDKAGRANSAGFKVVPANPAGVAGNFDADMQKHYLFETYFADDDIVIPKYEVQKLLELDIVKPRNVPLKDVSKLEEAISFFQVAEQYRKFNDGYEERYLNLARMANDQYNEITAGDLKALMRGDYIPASAYSSDLHATLAVAGTDKQLSLSSKLLGKGSKVHEEKRGNTSIKVEVQEEDNTTFVISTFTAKKHLAPGPGSLPGIMKVHETIADEAFDKGRKDTQRYIPTVYKDKNFIEGTDADGTSIHGVAVVQELPPHATLLTNFTEDAQRKLINEQLTPEEQTSALAVDFLAGVDGTDEARALFIGTKDKPFLVAAGVRDMTDSYEIKGHYVLRHGFNGDGSTEVNKEFLHDVIDQDAWERWPPVARDTQAIPSDFYYRTVIARSRILSDLIDNDRKLTLDTVRKAMTGEIHPADIKDYMKMQPKQDFSKVVFSGNTRMAKYKRKAFNNAPPILKFWASKHRPKLENAAGFTEPDAQYKAYARNGEYIAMGGYVDEDNGYASFVFAHELGHIHDRKIQERGKNSFTRMRSAEDDWMEAMDTSTRKIEKAEWGFEVDVDIATGLPKNGITVKYLKALRSTALMQGRVDVQRDTTYMKVDELIAPAGYVARLKRRPETAPEHVPLDLRPMFEEMDSTLRKYDLNVYKLMEWVRENDNAPDGYSFPNAATMREIVDSGDTLLSAKVARWVTTLLKLTDAIEYRMPETFITAAMFATSEEVRDFKSRKLAPVITLWKPLSDKNRPGKGGVSAMSDLLGASSDNTFANHASGYPGHSRKYYLDRTRAQGTEAFANMTALISQSDSTTMELLNRFFPDILDKYREIIEVTD